MCLWLLWSPWTLASGKFFLWDTAFDPEQARWCQFLIAQVADQSTGFRPHLYGLGCLRQPFPRVTLAEVTFSLFLCKINLLLTLGLLTHLGGQDNSGGRVISPRQAG